MRPVDEIVDELLLVARRRGDDLVGRDELDLERFERLTAEARSQPPTEARDTPAVWKWIERHVAGNGPIRRVEVVDVRQSMANGGGPACLRLRVAADPGLVDPRFLVDDAKLDLIASIVEQYWPEQIAPGTIADPSLIGAIERARGALLEALGTVELIDN